MRKSLLLLLYLTFGLSGCAPSTHDPNLRSREERPYPNPTLGTENAESQWYRTQTIAPPSPMTAATADAPTKTSPAKLSKTPTPSRASTPSGTPTGTVPVAN